MIFGIVKKRFCFIAVLALVLFPLPVLFADDFEVAETKPNPIENVGVQKNQKTYSPPIEKKGLTPGDSVGNPAGATIIKYQPNMTVQSLTGRSGGDMVEFSQGHCVSVADLRKLKALQQKMMVRKQESGMSALLVHKPIASDIKVKLRNGRDLRGILNRPDSDTVQLPSGRLATVGQIKFVQPYVEKRLGKTFASLPQGPDLSGSAVKISAATTKDQWKALFQNDNTVLESPNGRRIAVGELKEGLKILISRKTGQKTVPGKQMQPVKPVKPLQGRSK